MTFGTAPQALADYLLANWQASRAGRNDIPDVVRDSNNDPSNDPADGRGVLILHDREEVGANNAVHDIVHCYHPETGPLDKQDRGFDEQNVVEAVQVDIEMTDRTDPSTGERWVAKERMVGDRDSHLSVGDSGPPYPGVFGEVNYLLENIRKGLDEWDVNRHTTLRLVLKNSNADAAIDVQMERIAATTADEA